MSYEEFIALLAEVIAEVEGEYVSAGVDSNGGCDDDETSDIDR